MPPQQSQGLLDRFAERFGFGAHVSIVSWMRRGQPRRVFSPEQFIGCFEATLIISNRSPVNRSYRLSIKAAGACAGSAIGIGINRQRARRLITTTDTIVIVRRLRAGLESLEYGAGAGGAHAGLGID